MGFIQNYSELATTPERKIVLDLIETAISSIQPEKVLENFTLEDLDRYERVFLIGFGKGSAKVSSIIEEKLGEKLTEGYVIDVTSEQFKKIQLTIGTHPLPSQVNIDFTKRVVERFQNKLSEKDLVVVVVTGGGSALFELPRSLSLDELIKFNEELLKSGLNIQQMNEERKKLSQVKGGKLTKILSPAKVLGLIFSDVPGNDLSVVASGPTDDPSAENILMLSNKTALEAMKKKAEKLDLRTLEYSDQIQGEAREVGKLLIQKTEPNSILLAAGETTVTVHGNGKGGRNQELVLDALSNATIEQSNNFVIASFDSDGWDNTGFAGAIGDSQTLRKSKELNLNPQKFLDENNSFEFFTKVGDGIITGRLPSNISDLIIVYKT